MRIFFSYSHDDDEHKQWVRHAAADLANRGFDPILDQNDLAPGKDILHFAEAAIESSTYVLMVCTPPYAAKANGRTRGVGWEAQLISSDLFSGLHQGKFIALLRRGEADSSVPKFMKNLLYIDVRDGSDSQNWDSLCEHMASKGGSDQIGTLIYEALFPYDPERIYDQPRLPELKRFTKFIEAGQLPDGRWAVIREDPIKDDIATILFPPAMEAG